MIVTDGALSWPAVDRGGALTDFEEAILADRVAFGPGLFYFDARADRVFWVEGGAAAVMSLTGADPVTLEPERRWIALDMTTPRLLGTAANRAAAAALAR